MSVGASVRAVGAMSVLALLYTGCGDMRARPDSLFGVGPTPSVVLTTSPDTWIVPADALVDPGLLATVRGTNVPAGSTVVVAARTDRNGGFFHDVRHATTEFPVMEIRVLARAEDLFGAEYVVVRADVRSGGQRLAADSAVIRLE
jgi:hypothetical protein